MMRPLKQCVQPRSLVLYCTCSTASRVAWSVERLPGSHTTAAAASATAMLSSGAVRPRGSTLTSAVHLQQNKR